MKEYLFASDFDQTLSFNDSGHVLAEILGVRDFADKVAGLARINLVQQGGELAYLVLHDPELRQVRREHLREAGRRIRIKRNIPLLVRLLRDGVDGHRFSFNVVSAAPQEVIESALDGIVPPENIHATRFHYDAGSGEVRAIERVPAGYGKVAVLDELQSRLEIAPDRVVYVGDGSSDVHVMLHVNRREGYSIAVSEAPFITQIARRTVLSEDALSVLVPVLEDIAGWRRPAIRALIEAHGLQIHEWDRTRTDRVTIREPEPARG